MTDPRVLRFPATGEEVRFVETTEQTSGTRLVAEATIAPRSSGPPAHVHPGQDEEFLVLDGRGLFRIGREKREATAGETVVATGGHAHGIRNPFDRPLVIRVTWTPAFDLEHLFENLFGAAMHGPLTSRGWPPMRQMALIMETHPQSAGYIADVPRFIQGPVLKALAALGRRSGFKGTYPEYCPHQHPGEPD